MIYKVLFLDGKSINIEADGFLHNDEQKRVCFLKNNQRTALFNFNNIRGFYIVDEKD